jgi:hypothetical protein
VSKQSSQDEAERLRRRLIEIFENFAETLQNGSFREQVRSLLQANELLSQLAKSAMPGSSGKQRILAYLKAHPQQVIPGEELMAVAGISEWARRVRELRVEQGWPIVTGQTAAEMADEDEFPLEHLDAAQMRNNDYVLLNTKRDEKAARRWERANAIRKRTDLGMRDRLLVYFQENVSEELSGEELKYVAKGSEWGRRIRELRTEHGWPIATHFSGRPDLDVGVYVLEDDRQLPVHDRHIAERDRRRVLRRDSHKCQDCGWTHKEWNPSDPRHLELHHLEHHAEDGSNNPENLVTLCNICHDERHASEN